MMEVKRNQFGWLLLTTLLLLESKLALGGCTGTEITLRVDVNFREQYLEYASQYESVVTSDSGFEEMSEVEINRVEALVGEWINEIREAE